MLPPYFHPYRIFSAIDTIDLLRLQGERKLRTLSIVRKCFDIQRIDLLLGTILLDRLQKILETPALLIERKKLVYPILGSKRMVVSSIINWRMVA